ncbi:biotin transporter BioY [Paenibacillus yanchengensis]|uniref:Biotin transporter n=1 Tax=Paenibacillus yanchengensis TaxID=2035833 RepID=A0ABW4YLY8_9BACL
MKDLSIRSLVLTALFSALFIVLSLQQMKLASSVIPFTFQTLAVIIAGIFLKPRQAFLSIFIIVILGTIGLPIFGGKGGLAVVLGPTGGYIISFSFCAMFISIITNRFLKLTKPETMLQRAIYFLRLFVPYIIVSILFVHMIGSTWMMYVLDTSFLKALSLGSIPFIPGDLIKAAIGVILVLALPTTIRKTRA